MFSGSQSSQRIVLAAFQKNLPATQGQQQRIFQTSVVLISTISMLSLSQRLDVEIAGLGISKVYLSDNRQCVANTYISNAAFQPNLK